MQFYRVETPAQGQKKQLVIYISRNTLLSLTAAGINGGFILDYELFRNGSGYVDYTAYKAIKNIERNKKMDFNRGEIFEIETNRGESRKALIVSANFRKNNRFQSVIILTDEPKSEDAVPIVCEGMMYADCGMVSFTSEDRIINYIRTAREEEMEQIDEGIATCLGIELETIIVEKKKEPEEWVIPHEQMVKITVEEFVKAQTEAETYKDLYNQILSKVLSGQQA